MTDFHQSTLSVGATPASHSASLESSAEYKTRVISGQKCIASYEKSGRDGSYAKMLLGMLNSASTPYSLTWTTLATPQHRLLFRLVPSGRLIGGTVYGLLPTPLASSSGRIEGRKSDSLLVNYLPRRFGGIYPHPSLLEAMMGFPAGWTEPALSEMPSCLKYPKSLDGRSSRPSKPSSGS